MVKEFYYGGKSKRSAGSILAAKPVLKARAEQVTVAVATVVVFGLTTDIKAIRRAGLKPLMLASLLFTWLVVGGAGLNYAITAAFA